ncbi:hypothetical protein KR222_003393 [Zaprionus bogoriensis]|nr:hypothetical protein KR222_003393 [Zaprionus bogoriensis]
MTVNSQFGRSLLNEGRSSRRTLCSLIVGLIVGFCLAELLLYSTNSKRGVYFTYFSDHQLRRNNSSNYNRELVGPGPGNKTLAEKLYSEVRILCWVMTTPENHQTKAIHVKRTWGKRCNQLIFMSTTEDQELNAVALPIAEGRDKLWGKTKEAFKYIYEHHLNDADWFLKADDDTYTVLENLRYLLYPYNPETPVYFGAKFKPFVKQGYMSGGAGYALSREAVRRFVEKALPNPKLCSGNDEGEEDVELGLCMENVKVIAGDSRDAIGRGRFFPFEPEEHLQPPRVDKDYWYWQYIFYKTDEVRNYLLIRKVYSKAGYMYLCRE